MHDFKTGFHTIDDMNCLDAPRSYIIAGKEKSGKTALLCKLMADAFLNGKECVWIKDGKKEVGDTVVKNIEYLQSISRQFNPSNRGSITRVFVNKTINADFLTSIMIKLHATQDMQVVFIDIDLSQFSIEDLSEISNDIRNNTNADVVVTLETSDSDNETRCMDYFSNFSYTIKILSYDRELMKIKPYIGGEPICKTEIKHVLNTLVPLT